MLISVSRLTSLGAEATLLDPLEVNPPLLQQPLHFMKVSLGKEMLDLFS